MTTYRATSRTAALLAAGTLTALLAAPGAAAAAGPAPDRRDGPVLDGSGECTFPMKKQIVETPWPLQRVLLDELWQDTKGKGVRVAVIDTGVDDVNPQLQSAVDAKAGKDYLKPDKENPGFGDEQRGKTDGTVDQVGHGTKVAGIIAARPRPGTGFVGLAPEATIIPIRQNDEKNSGKADTMAQAIKWAVDKGAHVINISQDTTQRLDSDSDMAKAVAHAIKNDVVVVASASTTTAWTAPSRRPTRPRSPASSPSPPPTGTTSAPRSPRPAPSWVSPPPASTSSPRSPAAASASTTAPASPRRTSPVSPPCSAPSTRTGPRPRSSPGSSRPPSAPSTAATTTWVGGWSTRCGRSPTPPGRRPRRPRPTRGRSSHAAPEPARLALSETPQERSERLATYTLGIGVVLVAVVAGVAVVIRDSRRRREVR